MRVRDVRGKGVRWGCYLQEKLTSARCSNWKKATERPMPATTTLCGLCISTKGFGEVFR